MSFVLFVVKRHQTSPAGCRGRPQQVGSTTKYTKCTKVLTKKITEQRLPGMASRADTGVRPYEPVQEIDPFRAVGY